jgi:gas vesicle protein
LDKDQVKAHARAHVFNREGEITMADQSGNCSGVGVSIAFLSGAVLGAVAAILYAPRSGEETRTALRGYARRTEEEMLEKAREIRKDISETVDEAKQYLRETEATIAAALAAGKDAFKKERADRA